MVFLLVVAGHETTVNLIGNGTLALLQHPQQCDRLRGDRSLYRAAVEELLRFYSPVEVATERYAREPIEIAGITIPKDALVCPVLASANRDPSHFERADELDVGRETNRHLAFGDGIHFWGLPWRGSKAESLSTDCSRAGAISGSPSLPTSFAGGPASTCAVFESFRSLLDEGMFQRSRCVPGLRS